MEDAKLMTYKKIWLSLLTLIICVSCFSLTEEQKCKIFYNYESMFIDKNQENTAENGKKTGIFDLKEVSMEYQLKTKQYLTTLTNFITNNNKILTDFSEEVMKNKYAPFELLKMFKGKEKGYNLFTAIKTKIKNEILDAIPECARVMEGIYYGQYYEIPKEIGNMKLSMSEDWMTLGIAAWGEQYFKRQTMDEKELELYFEKDKKTFKYKEWFFETNMKIRIVKQIRDKDDSYCGELVADFYKIGDFDKLFDEKGNPRKLQK
jgi:hypothetical protein